MSEKRLFIAAEIVAEWPLSFPPARLLDEHNRHITLVFLGQSSITTFPPPPFEIGLGGFVKEWIFLPDENKTRVVAASVTMEDGLIAYQAFLDKQEKRPFLPHITVGRGTIDVEAWKKFTTQIPFYVSCITLFESLGHSTYAPLEKHPLIAPFEEIEHTADIAFLVRGKTFQDLGLHATLALAFKFPPLIPFIQPQKFDNLDQIVIALNQLIAIADQAVGCPFKAVSYHAALSSQNHLEWTMIIDV